MIARSLAMGLILVLGTLVVAPYGEAALIVAGNTTFVGRAIQDVRVLGGTRINPGPEFIMDDLYGDGYFTIARDLQSGSSITFVGVDSVFAGSRPEIGPFTFGAAGAVGVGSFLGTIDNVIQNPADPGFPNGSASSFQSGDLTLQVPSFYFRLANGVILETGASFTFLAAIDGLPNRTPTLLEGRTVVDEIPVFFGNELVGYSSDRRIELAAVPEPSTLLIVGLGMVGLAVCDWRRKRTN